MGRQMEKEEERQKKREIMNKKYKKKMKGQEGSHLSMGRQSARVLHCSASGSLVA
jgi:hypothetical protein